MNDILTVRDLSVHFRQGKRLVQLVDRVSFSVARGECLGILGESGSGKSMTCKALLGLLDDNFQVTGSSRFEGRPLLSQTPEQLRRLRGGKISMVLQNPMSCFDPLYRIGEQMAETLQEHTSLKGRPLQKRMEDILCLMRIHDPADVLRKYPHQLSGGMLQRVMIGLAICMQPSLIIADEPTTAIDSISQYAIMQEFLRIKQRGEVSMIFISHDLGVLSLIADRLIVMHDGKAVESGTFGRSQRNAGYGTALRTDIRYDTGCFALQFCSTREEYGGLPDSRQRICFCRSSGKQHAAFTTLHIKDEAPITISIHVYRPIGSQSNTK